MFGQLLDMLDHSVDFDQENEFIDSCKDLSAVRNQLVHELDTGVSLPEIKKLAEKCATLRGRITDEFNSADVRDTAWDSMLKQKKHAANADEATRIEVLTAKLQHARQTSPLHPRVN